MKRGFNWQKFLSLNQRKYAGRFVVIVGGKLVGAGSNVRKLLALAKERHPLEVPFVARVRDTRKLYVY